MDFSNLKTTDVIVSVYPAVLFLDIEFSKVPDVDIVRTVEAIQRNPGFKVVKMEESKYMVLVPKHYPIEEVGARIKKELVEQHHLEAKGQVMANAITVNHF